MGMLIRGAAVLTQDAKRRALKGFDVLVEGDRIARVGKGIRARAETEIDGRGKLVMPGLVNAHTHAAMAIFRGLADDREFFPAWKEKIWPAEKALKPRHVYAGSRLGIAEMLLSGTTAFLDMYFFARETERACNELGARAVLSPPFFDEPLLDGSAREALRLPKGGALVSYAAGPHAPYTVGRKGFENAEEASAKRGLRLHTHVSETREEVYNVKKATGLRPVEWLSSVGAVSGRLVAAHCTWITKSEATILGRAGASAALCPVANMKLAGGGAAPVPELVQAGANVALGTDGPASNNSLNMFETMKMCSLLSNNSRWDARAVSAQQCLDFATINGARALGIDAGSVEEGKLADLLVLDLGAPNLFSPEENPAAAVVYSANPSNVEAVIVGGKIAALGGKLASGNAEGILSGARKAAREALA
jgi:5-methylthioadenosine/S-adenosylhomocysteine deaminase